MYLNCVSMVCEMSGQFDSKENDSIEQSSLVDSLKSAGTSKNTPVVRTNVGDNLSASTTVSNNASSNNVSSNNNPSNNNPSNNNSLIIEKNSNAIINSSGKNNTECNEHTASTFVPPKTLPELAKDMYKSQYEPAPYGKKNQEPVANGPKLPFNNPISQASAPPLGSLASAHMVSEPSFSSVPRLDSGTLGLLRNNNSVQRQEYTSPSPVSNNYMNSGLAQSNTAQQYFNQPYPQQQYTQNSSFNQNLDEQKIRNIIQNIVSEELKIFLNSLTASSQFSQIIQHPKNNEVNSGVYPNGSNNSLGVMHPNSPDIDIGSKLSRLADLERLMSISRERYDVARNVSLQIEYDLRCKREEVRLLLGKNDSTTPVISSSSSSVTSSPNPYPSSSSNPSMNNSFKSSENSHVASYNLYPDLSSLSDGSSNISGNAADISGNPISSANMHSSLNSSLHSSADVSFDRSGDMFQLLNKAVKPEYGDAFIAELKVLKEASLSDPAKYFYLSDGQVLRSINDLIGLLANVSDENFFVHVNSSKNDFADWIEGVFGFSVVANRIRGVFDKTMLLDLLSLN